MYKRYFIIVLLIMSGCIDPINFKYGEQVTHLVVQAKFSNLPGPHYIRLSVSQPFDGSYQDIIKDAEVYVSNEQGERIDFPYNPDIRLYVNENGRAEIGRTYRLHITTPEGKVYQSTPVTIQETVPIDSIQFKYGEQLSLDGKEMQPGYHFNAVYSDPADTKNFYMWSYSITYEIITQPHDYMDYSFVPARNIPKSCCKQCWVNDSKILIVPESDFLSNGQQVIGKDLFFLPFYQYMNNKIKVSIFQYSVSEEAYNFFSTLEKQRASTGSVFDPPPTQNQGNIFNVHDSNEFVIGYFDASAASSKQIVISEKDIPYEIKLFVFADDCREFDNAKADPPVDW